MKRVIVFLLTILTLFSLFRTVIRENGVKADEQPIWPMVGYNSQRTSQCPYDTSWNNGLAKWKYKIGYSLSSPAIGSDGTIYVGSKNGILAVNPDGTLKWKLEGDFSYSSPAIGSDGTIYVGNYGGFYAFNPDGTLRWKFEGDFSYCSPSFGIDSAVYVTGSDNNMRFFYAFNPDGTLKWKYEGLFNSESNIFAVSKDGTIYANGSDFVYVLKQDGTLKYKWNISTYLKVVISQDGTVYLSTSDSIKAYSSDGNLKWRYGDVVSSRRISIASSLDGTLFATPYGKGFYVLNQNGTLKFSKENIGNFSSLLRAPMAISKNDEIFYACEKGIYALKKDGALKWKFIPNTAQDESFISIIINSDGTLYATSVKGAEEGYLYAIGNPEVSPPSAPQNLSAKLEGSKVRLTWAPSTQGTFSITGYAILKSNGGLDYILLDTTDANTTTYADYSPDISKTCSYYVVAFDNRIPPNYSFPSNITYSLAKIILQVGNSHFLVNGEGRTLDSPPIIKNSRTLLPIRAVVEALGGTIGWEPTLKIVTISLNTHNLSLQIGSSKAMVDGKVVQIDPDNSKVVPEIINSRTMLPLRFVAESLGCDVQWDGTTKTITITYQQ